ncbi:type II toxin-antitoxin system RelB/DinJ family antitoxin [Pelagibacterium sediminicola]|uniref:type II toxin-antitoxin system RelB/DinJ family antitoxin n=1 Tax=Pelagibacterium sediminicola TaxID=2248761 RepID=UPI000E311B8D|nr:type II toxin-antitoxin system RelB/DinJ family antitoxin [Pelagibacterium sediminicola]
MAANAVVRARIDEDVKDEATAVLAEMGLTVSDILRMTLIRVARDKAVPFELKVPNAETRAAMEEADQIIKERRLRFKSAEEIFDALEKETDE